MAVLVLVLAYWVAAHANLEPPCVGRDAYLERCRPVPALLVNDLRAR